MNFEFNIFLYDHIIEIKMNKSVKRRANACVEEGLRMNLQSQSQILSYHDESEEERKIGLLIIIKETICFFYINNKIENGNRSV